MSMDGSRGIAGERARARAAQTMQLALALSRAFLLLRC